MKKMVAAIILLASVASAQTMAVDGVPKEYWGSWSIVFSSSDRGATIKPGKGAVIFTKYMARIAGLPPVMLTQAYKNEKDDKKVVTLAFEEISHVWVIVENGKSTILMMFKDNGNSEVMRMEIKKIK